MIPDEVEDAVKRQFCLDHLEADHLRYYPKSEIDRGSSWVHTLKTAPPVTTPGWQWIWRKRHTENYWVWYINGLYDTATEHRVRLLVDPQPGDRVKHLTLRVLGSVVTFHGLMNAVTVCWDSQPDTPMRHPTHVIHMLDIVEQIGELDE